jgi:hypothetical protein
VKSLRRVKPRDSDDTPPRPKNLFQLDFLGFAIDHHNALGKCVATDILYELDPKAKLSKPTKAQIIQKIAPIFCHEESSSFTAS